MKHTHELMVIYIKRLQPIELIKVFNSVLFVMGIRFMCSRARVSTFGLQLNVEFQLPILLFKQNKKAIHRTIDLNSIGSNQ